VGIEYIYCFFLGWFYLGDTKVLAAVYGPKAGTKKNENPEKACIEVIWKPKTGQIG
jgi:exosome complex component RRP46